MKKLQLIIILLFLAYIVNAQSYEITYIKQTKMSEQQIQQLIKKLDDSEIPAHLKKQAKEGIRDRVKIKYYHSLKYVNGKSVYSFLKMEDAPLTAQTSQLTTYKDLKKGKIYSTGAILSSNEAIEKDIKETKWKFEKGTKEVLGYTCKKAYYLNNKNQKTVAWYTTKIPIMDGPDTYNGLPGLILKIEGEKQVIK